VAVGVLGLDRFKTINDSLGHETGDLLLREIAMRLHAVAGDAAGFSRLGSDEFAFFVRDVRERAHAEAVARNLAVALEPSLVPKGEEIYVHATTGFSMYPQDAGHAAQLISQAHVAMRGAKLRNAPVGFHSGPSALDGRRRLGIETHLRRALERAEFTLHYQPIIELGNGDVTGVEALLRWSNPKLGRVAPDEFIPLAEETGMIGGLGAWVLQEACRFGKRWLDIGGAGDVSVNVSARQFDGGTLTAVVGEALEISSLPATKLTLEITESSILRSPEVVFATVEALRKHGVRCHIDDFGTGYSSLARLAQFRVDGVKIDRSFLRDLGKPVEAGADALLVRAIVSLGRAMKLAIVAEGVETEAQRDFLLTAGCERAQGYLFAKPMPEDDLFMRTLAGKAGLDVGASTFWGGPAL
jgi:diguanylate cyclase (GGDEF)-like protein